MAPLVETGDVVDALEVYDGDVIEHPVTAEVVTIVAAMQNGAEPNVLMLTPGVTRFDVFSDMNFDGDLGPETSPWEDLTVTPGLRVRRLWKYVPPPDYRPQ